MVESFSIPKRGRPGRTERNEILQEIERERERGREREGGGEREREKEREREGND